MFIFNLFSDQSFRMILGLVILILVIFSLRLNKKYKFGFGAICLSFICFSLMYIIVSDYVNYFSNMKDAMKTQGDWGTMGDYLGGILNPILTFITIIILLWTTHNQNSELKKQLKRQDDESEKNDFNKMFSLLMEQNNQFLQNSSFKTELDNLYNRLTPNIQMREMRHPLNINHIEYYIHDYNEINTYTRFLYRFLIYLSEKENDKSNQIDAKHYSRILRSTISNKLLYILMMNGVRNESIGNFGDYRELLNEFNFLEHTVLATIYDVIDTLGTKQDRDKFLKLTRDFEHNKADLLKFKLSDLEELTGFNLYLKYSPEAFDQNPYYIEKILPIINYFIENEIIEKEYWKK